MELRTFAETVLFSPELADKLRRPDHFTDAQPGRPIPAVTQPTRLPEHQLRHVDSRHHTHFPTPGELREERGRLDAIHFFANHELTALELMAMALLKFTDAPAAWRRSVAVTMRDEQDHARLYLEQLTSRGRAFGELPINDHFWRLGVGMTSPKMYAAVVGMTLEQANLDFADHYGRMFRALGDDGAADVLDRVLVDEIRHVRHGVLFLEAWKDPNEDLWDAWRRELPAPLTPARAKGPGFVLGPRREAGLPEAFISRLRAYSYSKGRPPRVHVFDDTAAAIAAFSAATASLPTAAARADLDCVMLPLCKRDDVLIVRRQPASGWWLELGDQGFELPQVVVAQDAGALARALEDRTLGQLVPWRWTPHVASLFASIEDQVVASARRTAPPTDLDDRQAGAAHQLATTFEATAPNTLLPTASPHASADEPVLHLTGLLRIDGAQQVHVLGQTQVLRDAAGRRQATVVGKRHRWLAAPVRRFVHGDHHGPSRVARRMHAATQFVGERLADEGFRGFAAVDGVVVASPVGGRDPHAPPQHDGRPPSAVAARYSFNPIAAVHRQLTPAHIAIALRHHVAAASTAVFCVLGRAELANAAKDDLIALVHHLRQRLPMEATPRRKEAGITASLRGATDDDLRGLRPGQQLRQGVVTLGNPAVATGCVAVVLIAKRPRALGALLVELGMHNICAD